MTDADLRALVLDLAGRVTAHERELAAQERELASIRQLLDPRARGDDRLLNELAGHAKQGDRFTAAEAVEAGAADPDLADAINAVAPPGRWQALKLGKAFARLQGRRVGDFVFRRLGDDREGASWGFVRE